MTHHGFHIISLAEILNSDSNESRITMSHCGRPVFLLVGAKIFSVLMARIGVSTPHVKNLACWPLLRTVFVSPPDSSTNIMLWLQIKIR